MALAKLLFRILTSFGAAFLSFYPSLLLARIGFSGLAIAWFFPGQIIASVTVRLLPRSWVFGDPASDSYWPQASYASLTFICAVLFWGIAILTFWELFRARLHRPEKHA
jgi:hypothetical protein